MQYLCDSDHLIANFMRRRVRRFSLFFIGFLVINALLIGAISCAMGNEYYVGGAGASDANPGTRSQPFASLQKASEVAVAADIIRIRGGIYRETVVPAHSGAPGQPIIFEPDGDAIVTVSGADPADGGWTKYQGSIYMKVIALPVTGYWERITDNTTLLANQVFVGGKMMIEARWPNVSNADDLLNRADFKSVPKDGWMTHPSGTTLRDPGIPDIRNGWTGGTIWFIGWYQPQSSTIATSSVGQIEFPATAQDKFHDAYYLTGRLGALDAEKEWHYDGTHLFLWAPGGSSPMQVEVKMRNYAFDLRGKSHITLNRLNLFAATITTDTNSVGITLDGLCALYISHFVTVKNIDSHRHETGIRLLGSNSSIRNCRVAYSAGSGIVLGGADAVADNNMVHDVSYGGTYSCGIWPAPGGTRQTITRNTIHRTGRSCIDGVYSNKEIAYNDLYDFGLINTDLGAIYAANGADLSGSRIHHNWLHDAGNNNTHEFPVGAGIYFDQNAKPAQIDHNVFWNNHKNDIRLEQSAPPFHRIFNNTLASTDTNFWHSFNSYPASSPTNCQNNVYRSAIKPNTAASTDLTVKTDPRFVDAGLGGLRFRLQPDSPAIDRGIVIPAISESYAGSAPDLGAYEYGGIEWIAGCALK